MLASAFHHTQNIFYTFIYAEQDALFSLRDFLLENNYVAYMNPGKNDKNFVLQDGTIILRPNITRSKSVNNMSSIEKVLVDLYIEGERLGIIDRNEYEKIFSNIFNYRLNISLLMDYSERRKIDDNIKEILEKYTNAI
jgi:hypothetical protein